jgi:hypothetical protein
VAIGDQLNTDDHKRTEDFLRVRVPAIIECVQTDIRVSDRLFVPNDEVKPFEERNRNVTRALLQLRLDCYSGHPDGAKSFWLDRYVRGLFLDFKRIDEDVIDRKRLGESPAYSQTRPSPLTLSELLTIFAAKRAHLELRQAGHEFDVATVIHGVGVFIRFSLYVWIVAM